MNNNTETRSKLATTNTTTQKGTEPLKKFFVDGLNDMLWAEKALLPGLEKLQKVSNSEELSEAFEDHLFQTQKHISRLEKALQSINEKPEPKKCKAMEGILKEVDEIINATPEQSAIRDAMAIIAAQKVEHYEIASYGGLVALAHTLEYTRAADLLQKTLDEEESTDLQLTDIAERYINLEAKEETEETAATQS
jgi:ferritin-like metal-binding protein YciE